MGFFNFISKEERDKIQSLIEANQAQAKELKDVKARLLKTQKETLSLSQFLKNKRTNLTKPLQFQSHNITGGGNSRNKQPFTGPVYDLSEITRALDVESYVAISVRKHREQILKEGYSITGENQEAVDYIKRRLFEFSLVSDTDFDEVLREYTTNLIQYATSFIVIARDPNASSGSRYKWRGKKHDPVAALFPMNPTTVSAQRNGNGHIAKWEQRLSTPTPNGQTTKDYDKENVISATVDKKTGFIFGTPYILPVLDDVRVLRRIEEIAEVVGQRHVFPWTHWKVGTDDFPAQDLEDGSTEVDIVRQAILNTPPEGGIVTDHRVEGTILGVEGKAIDLVPYLGYFEKRVMAGLRLSPEDLGRSEGSKGGGQVASETLQEASKDFQAVISSSLSRQLFIPLLLEGGFDVNEENMVRLEFRLINREEDRARISHGQDQFLASSITRNEFRKEYLKKKEMSDEEDGDTVIGRKERQELTLAKMSAAAKASSAATSGATKKNANTTRPKNQNGQKPAKTRIKANDITEKLYLEALDAQWYDTRKMLESFVDKLNQPATPDKDDPADLTTREDELKSILETLVIFFSKDSKPLLLPAIQDGSNKAVKDTDNLDSSKSPLSNRSIDRFIKNNVTKALKIFIASLKDEILNNDSILNATSTHPQIALAGILDNRTDELAAMSSKHVDIAYRFGYAKMAKFYGCDSITLSPVEGSACEDCLDAGDREINMLQKDIPYNILLHTHSNCEFKIKI